MGITCEEVGLGLIGLGYIKLVMRMRRWPWSMTSPFHLTTSSSPIVGNTECTDSRDRIWKSDLRHNVHIKFHKYPSSHSLIIKCVHTGISSEVGLDWVWLR
jgi:hypothetical protein